MLILKDQGPIFIHCACSRLFDGSFWEDFRESAFSTLASHLGLPRHLPEEHWFYLQEGDPSHALYVKERQNLLDSLHRRASQLYKALNELEGITCNEPEGALYCMPRIRLSKKVLEVGLNIPTLLILLAMPARGLFLHKRLCELLAGTKLPLETSISICDTQWTVQEAEKIGKAPDFLYCKELLDNTGIVTVPGSGFRQVFIYCKYHNLPRIRCISAEFHTLCKLNLMQKRNARCLYLWLLLKCSEWYLCMI